MSADDVATSSVVTVSVGLLQESEFYVPNTDKWSDANSETSWCGYTKHRHTRKNK